MRLFHVKEGHYKHCTLVYITIVINILSISGTMIVSKNIFVSKGDICTFEIYIRNYSVYSVLF
eukprot:UN03648